MKDSFEPFAQIQKAYWKLFKKLTEDDVTTLTEIEVIVALNAFIKIITILAEQHEYEINSNCAIYLKKIYKKLSAAKFYRFMRITTIIIEIVGILEKSLGQRGILEYLAGEEP